MDWNNAKTRICFVSLAERGATHHIIVIGMDLEPLTYVCVCFAEGLGTLFVAVPNSAIVFMVLLGPDRIRHTRQLILL